jgi:5-methyltetrahydropteroyltriglutamate--homocysteine methyltransferase
VEHQPVKRSTDRILTTHVGSLVRTPAILEAMKARALNRPYDPERFLEDVRHAIKEVVRKQAEVGIDVPSNGEFGRAGFQAYINERLSGLEVRELHEGENPWGDNASMERTAFPGFYEQYSKQYRYLWMPPEVDISEVPNRPGNYERCRVVGPITYKGQSAIKQEIATFKESMAGLSFSDAFMPADLPTSRIGDEDILNFYPSVEAYLYAVADAMREEYRTITSAGLILQLDLAALTLGRRWTLTERQGMSDADKRRAIDRGVEIINHALHGIPEEQVRYHHCWGSGNSPHTLDAPLRTFVDTMLRIRAQAYSIEAANPRHEHEWMLWGDVKLPDGKILIPGLISHQTNVVEHPELVAWRIQNFASLVGKENIIAGADCGFSQYWDSIRVHPSVQWAKLKALADGAILASRQLWGRSDPSAAPA